jgi:hypothetical protein
MDIPVSLCADQMSKCFIFMNLFAQRVTREAGNSIDKRVALVIRLAYGRPAGDDETRLASHFAKEHGLPALCRVVFNSNEFVFVE